MWYIIVLKRFYSSHMIKIGVVGYGYWGPNLVRNFFVKNSCILKTIADSKNERLAQVQKNFPSIKTTTKTDG